MLVIVHYCYYYGTAQYFDLKSYPKCSDANKRREVRVLWVFLFT